MTQQLHNPFDTHRLAASFVEAAYAGDDDTVFTVLDMIDNAERNELPGFILALVAMIEHALHSRRDAPMSAFLTAYRDVLDRLEALLTGGESPPEN